MHIQKLLADLYVSDGSHVKPNHTWQTDIASIQDTTDYVASSGYLDRYVNIDAKRQN